MNFLSYGAKTYIFHFFFLPNYQQQHTGLQGPSLNTSNDAAPSSSPSQAWKYSGIIQDHCSCRSPFQGYGIEYSQVWWGGLQSIISPASINNSNTLWRDTQGSQPGYGIPTQVQAVVRWTIDYGKSPALIILRTSTYITMAIIGTHYLISHIIWDILSCGRSYYGMVTLKDK